MQDSDHKKAGVAIHLSEKRLKTKKLLKINRNTLQSSKNTIIKIYIQPNKASKYMKLKMTEKERERNNSPVTAEDFNSPFSIIGKNKKKFKK